MRTYHRCEQTTRVEAPYKTLGDWAADRADMRIACICCGARICCQPNPPTLSPVTAKSHPRSSGWGVEDADIAVTRPYHLSRSIAVDTTAKKSARRHR